MARIYMPGEVWSFKNRSHEPNARLFIAMVDRQENGEEIFHIALDGLQVKSANAPDGYVTELGHLPISRQSLEASIVSKLQYFGTVPDVSEGRDIWIKAFEKGEAGIFDIPVAEIIQTIETSIAPS